MTCPASYRPVPLRNRGDWVPCPVCGAHLTPTHDPSGWGGAVFPVHQPLRVVRS